MSNSKKLWFVLVFAIVGFIALQVPVAKLQGSKAAFTLFDLFGPTAGGFLGAGFGILAVAVMNGVNFVVHGAQNADAGAIIRLFPMLFATLYFGRKSLVNIFIPAIAIAIFWINPESRQAWYYALYWLIPIACYFFQERSLLLKSLGATFMAHSVGGALWVLFNPIPASVWRMLVPITAMERIIFALGITATYLVLNTALNYLARRHFVTLSFLVNPRFVLWQPNA